MNNLCFCLWMFVPTVVHFFNIYFKTMALQQLLMHASAFASVFVYGSKQDYAVIMLFMMACMFFLFILVCII